MVSGLRVHTPWEQACKQLERGRSRVVNLFQVATARVVGWGIVEQGLGESEDDTEVIPEVVAERMVVRHLLSPDRSRY